MNDDTFLNPNLNINMTYRVGEIQLDRSTMVEILGEPHYLDGDKTTMEWIFQTPDGVATLYDYKQPHAQFVTWSIGGHSEAVVPHVQTFIRTRLNS
jgi:hypothetical protein